MIHVKNFSVIRSLSLFLFSFICRRAWTEAVNYIRQIARGQPTVYHACLGLPAASASPLCSAGQTASNHLVMPMLSSSSVLSAFHLGRMVDLLHRLACFLLPVLQQHLRGKIHWANLSLGVRGPWDLTTLHRVSHVDEHIRRCKSTNHIQCLWHWDDHRVSQM